MNYPIVMPMPIRTGCSCETLSLPSSSIEKAVAVCIALFIFSLIVAVCFYLSRDNDSTIGKTLVWIVAAPLLIGICLILAVFL